ncbi:MAG: ATP-binding protein [Candidatus Limnocylindrales bacterium]
MRITSLSVRNLGRHRDARWVLDPGMTVVRGPNESGKSTLQHALELVLTRPATSTAPDLDALRTWGAGPSAAPAVAITFSWDDEEGAIHEGRLAKVFAGVNGAARLELDGRPVADPARAEETFAELSGVPTEGFLRSTASVRQTELAGLQRDETALRDRLTATMSGADRSTARARRRLLAALADLGPRNGGPGRLGTAVEAVADAERRLANGQDGLARLEHDREAHTLAKERRAASESALTERRSQLEKARQAERLHAERDDAQARHDRFAEAIALRDELAELDATHPSPMPLVHLRPAVERLRTLETRISTLEQLLSSEVHVDFELPPERAWQPQSRLGLALAAVGLILVAGGIAVDVVGVANLGIVPVVVGLVVAAAGVAAHFMAIRGRDANVATRQMRDEEVTRRLRGRSDMEEELRRARIEREEALATLELPGAPEAEERLAAETAHVARIDQGRARLSGLIGDEHPDTLPSKRDAAAAEIARTSAALDALGPIAKEPRARERLEVEVRDAEGVADRMRDDESAARARVDQNPVDAEDVAGLAERLASWRADLAELRRRERILSRTLAELDAAEQATMARATRFLERQMVADVARLTGGRYHDVRMDDTALALEVRSTERGDWVSVGDLSRGTLDAIYLAARLGLVRLVTGDRRPPLILDDPLVSLDDDRASRALAVLRELTPDFQVIYLTASPRYDALADVVIELPGPEAVANS